MKLIVQIVLVALVVIILGVWLRSRYIHSQAAAVAETFSQKTAVSKPTNQSQGPYTIAGIAIMDTSTGSPAVPYIKYTDSEGKLATKQLIFADTRGCMPGAGDIPCAPTYSAKDGYPVLTDGESITVTGYILENRFLITSFTVES